MSHPAFSSFTMTTHTTAYPAIDPTQPSLSATNKVVFVTGGSGGIGKGIATYFAKAGAKVVVITGRTEASLLDTKNEIEQSSPGAKVHTCALDVVDKAAMNSAFSSVRETYGPIDVLVNNVGYFDGGGPIATIDFTKLWRGFEVNILGGLIATQAFLNTASKNATLINISSGAAHLHGPGFAGYSASKLGLAKVMEFVQNENPDMKVFNVQPGVVQTALATKANRPARDHISLPSCFCVWLASPESDFLKGRFVWSNWDVTEMKERAAEISEKDLLRIKLDGWDTYEGRLPYK